MRVAVIRDVSRSLGDCELSHVDRVPIDIERAGAQHRQYADALAACGCRVIALHALHDLPDAVFVEDVALVFDDIAIGTRPGAPSRRPEAASVVREIARHRPMRMIEVPATLDGGDVLVIGRCVYVGRSDRTNAAGIAQLGALFADGASGNYTVEGVPIRGCLHLKSAVTGVADGIVLVNPDWVDRDAFAGFRQIDVDPDEPHAANALRVGDRVIYPSSFPRTRRRLEAAGVAVTVVDVSELQKAEGAVTCCSLVFESDIV
jgi:dimethylargininase